MSSGNLPTHLYHYTSVNTLALILKSRQIKFNSLPMVDDMEEALLKEDRKNSKYIFISAWTKEEKESIAMWEMYSQGMRGVRIRLPVHIFSQYALSEEEKLYYCKDPEIARRIELNSLPVTPEKFFTSKANYSANVLGEHFIKLEPVEYTEDENLICPDVVVSNEHEYSINLSRIGRYKRSCWEFQSEWRYIAVVVPGNVLELFKMNNRMIYLFSAINANVNLPFTSDYFDIDPIKFADMEITLGPMTNDADRVIVQALTDKFNPTAVIKESALKGKIRKQWM